MSNSSDESSFSTAENTVIDQASTSNPSSFSLAHLYPDDKLSLFAGACQAIRETSFSRIIPVKTPRKVPTTCSTPTTVIIRDPAETPQSLPSPINRILTESTQESDEESLRFDPLEDTVEEQNDMVNPPGNDAAPVEISVANQQKADRPAAGQVAVAQPAVAPIAAAQVAVAPLAAPPLAAALPAAAAPAFAQLDQGLIKTRALHLLLQIPIYRGQSDDRFDDWVRHLDNVLTPKNWAEREKIRALADRLGGSAYDAFHSLIEPGETYETLKRKLKEQYHGAETRTTYQRKFEERFKQPGESIPNYAYSLKNLYIHAYPHLQTAADRFPFLKRAFTRGLSSKERLALFRKQYV